MTTKKEHNCAYSRQSLQQLVTTTVLRRHNRHCVHINQIVKYLTSQLMINIASMNARVLIAFCVTFVVNNEFVSLIQLTHAANEKLNIKENDGDLQDWPDGVDNNGVPIDRIKIAGNTALENRCGWEPTHAVGKDAMLDPYIRSLDIPENWFVPEVSFLQISTKYKNHKHVSIICACLT